MRVFTRLTLALVTAAGLMAVLSAVYLLRVLPDGTTLDQRTIHVWPDLAVGAAVEIAGVVLLTGLVVRWRFVDGLARTAGRLRSLRTGAASSGAPVFPATGPFTPLAAEVTHLVKSLEEARAAAKEEARLRDAGESLWTRERLRAHLRTKVNGRPFIVVSNREPYMHVQRGRRSEVLVPASGLVTAIEPILCACDGTWIAHGSGDADALHVDEHDRLRVPIDRPEYTLRRVWLTPEEEAGYYFGFSNEGLWPLCHIAHTRPVFRASDWQAYRDANRRFADAVLDEIADTAGAFVLVQDYHFALLPRLVKAARPDARVAIFWHIPWPNPEAFGICPWQGELLDGLLGADLIGFHTRAHCNNFLDTVERGLESQVEWEHFTARRHDHLTHVRPFPISVACPEPPPTPTAADSAGHLRARLLDALGVQASFLAVGVDRVDYTKGILERFRGVELFLDRWAHYQGEFTLVQIGAPSRTRIKRYDDLNAEVEAEADRINGRFRTAAWQPIVLLQRHHSHAEIEPYYRAADVCLVTSLHDGMNLVAKEFVVARDDGEGALVLSRFAGACHELTDAIIVNPYDTEELAAAIHAALDMDPDERRMRMRRMRQFVREHNVYRWAATLIADLADLRTDAPVSVLGRVE